MSEKIEIVIYTKGELRDRRLPEAWTDPEAMTFVADHHRVMFLENPLSRDDGDPVRAYAVVDDVVAGKVSLIRGEVQVDGKRHRVLWGFDLLVSTRFRGRGLAIKLILAWQDHYEFAMGTHVNLQSVGIYRKFDWVEFHTPSYVSILKPRPFLQGYVKSGLLAAAASPLAAAALRLRQRSAPRPPYLDLRVERAESLPSEFDEHFARQTSPIMTVRSAEWVNWQMRVGAAYDGATYSLHLVRDASDEDVGYFILQLKRWPLLSGRFANVLLASMREWGIFDDQRCDPVSLSLLAAEQARQLDADAAMVTVSGEERGQALRAHGLRPVNPLMTVYHAAADSPLADPQFQDETAWRFTPAEADGLVV